MVSHLARDEGSHDSLSHDSVGVERSITVIVFILVFPAKQQQKMFRWVDSRSTRQGDSLFVNLLFGLSHAVKVSQRESTALAARHFFAIGDGRDCIHRGTRRKKK